MIVELTNHDIEMSATYDVERIDEKDADRSAPKTYKEWVELECKFCRSHEQGDTLYESSDWDGGIGFDYIRDIKFCPLCGRELFYESDEEEV